MPAAAFFDLDKTVIAKASMVAFGGPLYREGLVSRRLLARALVAQLVYVHFGAGEEKVLKMRDTAVRLTRGWEQANVRRIVRETLEQVIEPIVFDEALDLIREHRAAGRKVYIVSASPEEIVEPLAAYLGVDGFLATRSQIDHDGRYAGVIEFYCYGVYKAVAIRDLAEREGIDLRESYAYSDSATDLPMLEVVGHAAVVNPDRELRRAAVKNNWDVLAFTHRVKLRDRVNMPAPAKTAVGGGVLTAAIAAAVWWWVRRQPPPPPPRQGLRQRVEARTTGTARAATDFVVRTNPLVRRNEPSSRRPRPARRGQRARAASS